MSEVIQVVEIKARFFFVAFSVGFFWSLTEDEREPVVREVFMMLVMTGVRRGDEMGSRWQLENFMDERSLAESDGVKREEGEKLRDVSGKMSCSEWM